MRFELALELSNVDLSNIDLLDTHLDLLDTDIPSKNFVCLYSIFKTSSRYVLKTFSRHVFKTSSKHVFMTSSRFLQDQQMFSGLQLICKKNSKSKKQSFRICLLVIICHKLIKEYQYKRNKFLRT